jgi:hypothetical protein
MTLLVVLVAAGVVMALAGTLGLAGLQRWGMILFVPVFAGLIAALLGGTAMAMMLLVEWIGGTSVRPRYGAADFWSAVLIIAYILAFIFTAIGFRGEWKKKAKIDANA